MEKQTTNSGQKEQKYISVALWTHPRSMSTALERYFLERGDFHVFHEEFAYVFMGSHGDLALPHSNLEFQHPFHYEGVRDLMESARQTQPVFHKDMCYHALPHLLDDEEYLKSQTHIFLVRNPQEAVLSLATVHPELDFNTLGFAEMPPLYERIRTIIGKAPLIIDADVLAKDAEGVLAKVCEYIDIPFDVEALNWNASMPKQWDSWAAWHEEVASRTSIGKPRKNYNVDYESHPKLKAMAAFCQPFYEYFKYSSISIDREQAA